MTLADERRRLRDDMIAARRSGSDRRRIKDDLNALETTPRRAAQLRALERSGGRPAQLGVGNWDEGRVSQAGGGIASPLTEETDTRLYHPPKTVTSVDGLLSFVIQRVARVTMLDAGGETVIMEFQDVP